MDVDEVYVTTLKSFLKNLAEERGIEPAIIDKVVEDTAMEIIKGEGGKKLDLNNKKQNDYVKNRLPTKEGVEKDIFSGIPGRFVMIEKTYDKRKLRASVKHLDEQSDSVLWKLFSVAKAFKEEFVKERQYEMAATYRDYERNALRILLQRKKRRLM